MLYTRVVQHVPMGHVQPQSISGPWSPEISVVRFNKHNRSAECDLETLLADKMCRNYNTTFMTAHTNP
jgi:hypothetical protein